MNYLITGAWGKLGEHLRDELQGLKPKHEELDITNLEQVDKFVSRDDIDVILHMAAVTNRKQALENKQETYKVNVLGTRNIALTVKKYNKKIVYISTDVVFDGKTGNYKETDTPNPKDWYGYTKYAGELEIQNATDKHLIIRTSFRPIVWPFDTAFDDIYTSADYVDIIAKDLLEALSMNITGIIHIGTKTKIMYELAKQRNPNVKPEHAPDTIFFAKRIDLNIDKWTQLKKGEPIVYIAPTSNRIRKEHIARYKFATSYVKGKSVLDIASGTGYGTRILKDAGATYVNGIDIDKKAVDYAIENYGTDGLDFSIDDAQTFFDNKKYDVITSFETIEHVEYYGKTLRNFHSMLKDDGVLIISTPNRLVTSPHAKSINDKPSIPAHIFEFVIDEFVSALKQAGFVVNQSDLYGQSDTRRFKIDFFRKVYKIIRLVTKWSDPSRGPQVLRIKNISSVKIMIAVVRKKIK